MYGRGINCIFTMFLQHAHEHSLKQVGSKAMYLSKVLNEGVTIPNGFVINADALDAFMRSNDLYEKVEDPAFIELLMEAPMPDGMAEEYVTAYERLKVLTGDNQLSVAVRSSSSAEDLADASFAGQYDTILNVRDENQLLYAIKQCWASAFSDHVHDYAKQKNISLAEFPMSILVQQMVFADAAGVIFSINPITESNDEIIINASYGLGEAIVSGIVTPDTYIVHKETKDIMKDLGLKEVKIIPDGDGIKEVDIAQAESDVFCLTDEQVLALEAATATLERFYGFPIDIEFAIKDGQPFILQSRPITA